MLGTMSKPRKKLGRPAVDPADRADVPISYRATAAHKRQIEESARRNRRSESKEMLIALEKYLASQGLWPPPPPPN
jgi:hypothetical protein